VTYLFTGIILEELKNCGRLKKQNKTNKQKTVFISPDFCFSLLMERELAHVFILMDLAFFFNNQTEIEEIQHTWHSDK